MTDSTSDDRARQQLDRAARVQVGYDVVTHPENGACSGAPEPWVAPSEKHTPVVTKVAAVRELHTAKSERSCVHVEVDLSGTPPPLMLGIALLGTVLSFDHVPPQKQARRAKPGACRVLCSHPVEFVVRSCRRGFLQRRNLFSSCRRGAPSDTGGRAVQARGTSYNEGI